MQNFQLLVCGTKVSFRTEGDPAEIEEARIAVEERAERLKSCAKLMNKDQLLALLALNVVDELLQAQKRIHDVEGRLSALLERIGNSANSGERISLEST